MRRGGGRHRSSGWLGAAVLLAAAIALTGSFAQHMVHGRHGLGSRFALLERREAVERDVAALAREVARLRRDVTLLGPDIADPDLVEEVARDVLGFGRPGDIVIIGPRPGG